MQKKCPKDGCEAPKGLCIESLSQEYQQCAHFAETEKEEFPPESKPTRNGGNTIPWTGLALQPHEIDLLASRSTPTIIGTIGAAGAGKTSYLGMLYTLLFNGKRFDKWDFLGSYTLLAWETLAKYLKIKPNGKVDFTPPTPSNPDYYSLYHLALRSENYFRDVLFADSSGEVFTQWASNVNDPNAENARWIYANAAAFIFFIDCEAVIRDKGRSKQRIVQLAGQVAANLNNRPIVVVWSKADRLADVRPNIKTAIEAAAKRFFPDASTIMISNFSKKDPDVLCHQNNLAVTEHLLDKLSSPNVIRLVPEADDTPDFFFKYRGSYGSE